MIRHVGIVLRKDARHTAIFFLLDKELGKVRVASGRSDISCGSLMAYSMSSYGSLPYVYYIDVLDLPDVQDVGNLIFFHQVLELTYYFVPLRKVAPDIFDLLLFLYTSFERFYNDSYKKLFLCKLFAHMGFYPEADQRYIQFFREIRNNYIDLLIAKSLDLSLERMLDRWLDYCISLHPCADYFRTVSLLIGRKS